MKRQLHAGRCNTIVPLPFNSCYRSSIDRHVVDKTLQAGLIFGVKEDIDESYTQSPFAVVDEPT